ncbi:MAG: methanogenesis marker protein Mmp4/MtxX [Candidatus Verstraetearchaeota archaeon]|nr:methanogenesis marker protein Mmp4/MtxX [Candidatus Verstraetearchaeota archaeon]
MKLLELIRNLAKERRARVAVGVGWERSSYVESALCSALKAREQNFGEVVLVSGRGVVKDSYGFKLVESDEPWLTLLELLKSGEVDAAARGTLSASKVLKTVKQLYGLEKLHRIALLETADGRPFFFAPVGIDEGDTVKDKFTLIEHAVKLHKLLGLKPKIAILSGGRLEDFGRSLQVDRMLCEGEFLASMVKREGVAEEVKHYGILIEEAIADEATFILAPDGVSGNLIFRTLEFLGGGRGIAAVYTDLLPTVLLDVSRAMKDFSEAVALASALVELSQK